MSKEAMRDLSPEGKIIHLVLEFTGISISKDEATQIDALYREPILKEGMKVSFVADNWGRLEGTITSISAPSLGGERMLTVDRGGQTFELLETEASPPPDELREWGAKWLYEWSQDLWIKYDPDVFGWENITEQDREHYRESAAQLLAHITPEVKKQERERILAILEECPDIIWRLRARGKLKALKGVSND